MCPSGWHVGAALGIRGHTILRAVKCSFCQLLLDLVVVQC